MRKTMLGMLLLLVAASAKATERSHVAAATCLLSGEKTSMEVPVNRLAGGLSDLPVAALQSLIPLSDMVLGVVART